MYLNICIFGGQITIRLKNGEIGFYFNASNLKYFR
jgi:hypothetical protein